MYFSWYSFDIGYIGDSFFFKDFNSNFVACENMSPFADLAEGSFPNSPADDIVINCFIFAAYSIPS